MKKKGGNTTELQKPSIKAEVYDNSEKRDWGKKKKLKSLIGFLSANKIYNYNRGVKKGEQKKKKIQKNLQNKSKNKNNKCFSWVTAVRVLSRAGNHSPPYLPRMPSNTADLWTCCGGCSDSNLFYSCVFLPPVSTALRASAFSFVGTLNGLLYIP